MENLKLCKEREIEQREPHMITHTDASTKDWGIYCEEFQQGGKWSKEEKHFHINVLELLALKCAIPTSKNPEVNLEFSVISSDHTYCRVPSKQVESRSRLGVQE